MAALLARRDAPRAPPGVPDGPRPGPCDPDDVVRAMPDTSCTAAAAIDLLHARILRIWGERQRRTRLRTANSQRSDWRLWYQALGHLEWAFASARGIVPLISCPLDRTIYLKESIEMSFARPQPVRPRLRQTVSRCGTTRPKPTCCHPCRRPGYFDDAVDMLATGDMLLVSAPDGGQGHVRRRSGRPDVCGPIGVTQNDSVPWLPSSVAANVAWTSAVPFTASLPRWWMALRLPALPRWFDPLPHGEGF